MPTYLVTYKFGHDADFARRIDNFMNRVQVGDWWGETASSIIVHADEAIDAFCRRILPPAAFDERRDIAVVIDLDNRQGRVNGPLRDASLFTAAPWIKRP